MLSGEVDGEKLRALRERAGLSVEDLAATVGRTKWLIYDLEKNRCGPDAKVFKRICEHLGVPPEVLLVTPSKTENGVA